jgi:hypothetical protein
MSRCNYLIVITLLHCLVIRAGERFTLQACTTPSYYDERYSYHLQDRQNPHEQYNRTYLRPIHPKFAGGHYGGTLFSGSLPAQAQGRILFIKNSFFGITKIKPQPLDSYEKIIPVHLKSCLSGIAEILAVTKTKQQASDLPNEVDTFLANPESPFSLLEDKEGHLVTLTNQEFGRWAGENAFLMGSQGIIIAQEKITNNATRIDIALFKEGSPEELHTALFAAKIFSRKMARMQGADYAIRTCQAYHHYAWLQNRLAGRTLCNPIARYSIGIGSTLAIIATLAAGIYKLYQRRSSKEPITSPSEIILQETHSTATSETSEQNAD